MLALLFALGVGNATMFQVPLISVSEAPCESEYAFFWLP
jgi:hypothetical protein